MKLFNTDYLIQKFIGKSSESKSSGIFKFEMNGITVDISINLGMYLLMLFVLFALIFLLYILRVCISKESRLYKLYRFIEMKVIFNSILRQ